MTDPIIEAKRTCVDTLTPKIGEVVGLHKQSVAGECPSGFSREQPARQQRQNHMLAYDFIKSTSCHLNPFIPANAEIYFLIEGKPLDPG